MTPSVNNSVDFFEESGPVKLSFNLRFEDQDVGKKEFTNALIYITNGNHSIIADVFCHVFQSLILYY